MTNIGVLFVNFVIGAAAFFFLARFVLQLSRADFYNPISQSVVTLTEPVLRPLRTLLRPIGSFDPSSFTVSWALQALQVWALGALGATAAGTALQIAALALFQTLMLLTYIFVGAIFIIVIASWFVQGGFHPILALLSQVTEPIVGPIRRFMPDLGGIDLSPMVAIFGLFVLQEVLRIIFLNLPL